MHSRCLVTPPYTTPRNSVSAAEFELLDIRLMTLWGEVDHFVVVEGNCTHSGRPKPLHLQVGVRS